MPLKERAQKIASTLTLPRSRKPALHYYRRKSYPGAHISWSSFPRKRESMSLLPQLRSCPTPPGCPLKDCGHDGIQVWSLGCGHQPALCLVEGCSQRREPVCQLQKVFHAARVNRRFMTSSDFLAATPFETPPEPFETLRSSGGGSSGRTVGSSISKKISVRAEEAPSSQGPSRSPRSRSSTVAKAGNPAAHTAIGAPLR
jgi:hypothetical protein